MTIKKSLNEGFTFGITSGVITTLGLLVGLATSTHSKIAVVGGILSIAIADSLSDSMGMHIAQETNNNDSKVNTVKTPFFTFITKFFTALTFIVPVLLIDLTYATLFSILWGIVLLGILSYFLAKRNNENPLKVIIEHIFIGSVTVAASAILGDFISLYFS